MYLHDYPGIKRRLRGPNLRRINAEKELDNKPGKSNVDQSTSTDMQTRLQEHDPAANRRKILDKL